MDSRTLERNLQYIDEYKAASNAATGSKYDSNANVTNKNLATLQCEIGKKDIIDIRRAIIKQYLTKLYGEEDAEWYTKDIKHHTIYPNDESSLFPYCASISLYPFLLDGLKRLGGSSGAPKHADSFIGGIINLLFMVAAQFAGAIAVPEFLAYFDHFLRVDYGDDYIDHLEDVVDAFGNNRKTLRTRIYDWFQQFDYSINQPAGARNYQSPFTNIAYFDKYYFENIFKDFIFPDGDEPKWETTKELQKLFMRWFNEERTKEVLTFPVETSNCLVDKNSKEYKDEEMADFFAEMWSLGHSFFMYQSDSVDALASCCRLKNEIEDNVFSYTLGAGGVKTGSKCVITLNINRITQDWYKEYKETGVPLKDYIATIVHRVHKYLNAWNEKLWDDFRADMLPVYREGFIDLDKQYLTVGVNGVVEGAEFLRGLGDDCPDDFKGIDVDPFNEGYKEFVHQTLGKIKSENKAAKTIHTMYNLECVPGENLSAKLYNWDKKDGYVVPKNRVLYNSYFYPVEEDIDPLRKFYYQGEGFATECDGGVALHSNLDTHLTKEQYRRLMDVAVKAGCNYWTYNIPNTVCNECGHIDKRMLKACPKCGSTNIDYATRIIGYLKRISNFSAVRQEEASQRFYGKVEE